MAMFMKVFLWIVSLWVKLRMLIYDVFGIEKSSAFGRNFFVFEAAVCGYATPLGSGLEGVCLSAGGSPWGSTTLRLLLRETPLGSFF